MTDLHRQQHVVNGTLTTLPKNPHYYSHTSQHGDTDFFEPDTIDSAQVGGQPSAIESLGANDDAEDESRRIDASVAAARRSSREFSNFQHDEQHSIADMEKQLRRLSTDAEKRAAELEKSLERERRAELKEQRKLEEQERKTMKLAKELAERQKVAREWKEAERNLAEMRRIQVTQLAEQIVAKQEQLRSLAEQRANQLEAAEEAAKRHAHDLAAQRERDQRDASVMKKELRASEKVTKHTADELARLIGLEEYELDEMSGQLEKLDEEARIAEKLQGKHAAERAELERRARELAETEDMERQWAQSLREEQGAGEAAIETKQQLLTANERILHDSKFLSKRKAEERKSSKLMDEQEALEMVNKLATEQEARRNDAELTQLIEREKRELSELNEQVDALDEEVREAESLYEKHASERAELERRAWELAAAEERERERAQDFRDAQKANEAAIKNQEKLLSSNEHKLHKAELLAAQQLEERRIVEACARKYLQSEQEALEKARKLATEQEAARRAIQEAVAHLTAEEQEARRHAFELEQRELGRLSTQESLEVEEPDVIDVYQQSRYAAGQQQPELVSAVEHVEQHPYHHGRREGEKEEGLPHRKGSIVEKIAEGIKHIF